MKRKYCFLLIVVLLYSSSATMAEETASLVIGNASIKIGMEKSKVVGSLKGKYDYDVLRDSKDPTWENWSFWEKAKEKKAETFVGSITFSKNKVKEIRKTWGIFTGKDIASFGQELENVLSKLSKNGKTNVTIQIHKPKTPPLKSIYLVSGNHSITITVSDYGITLQENLSE